MACILGQWSGQRVWAAASDVGIEPAVVDEHNPRTQSIFIMSVKPGEQGKNGVRLVNSGKSSHTVNVYAVDGTTSVDGSFSCRQKAEPVKLVGGWVQLEKQDVTLEPGEQTVVNFTVDVPKGVEPGEHNGCIAVQDQANLPAKTGEGILLGFRSAIRLAVVTPGKIVKKLELKRVDVTRQKTGEYQVSPIAHNTGNVSLDVKSYAQLFSVFGQQSVLKSDATCPVMPGATMACPYTFEQPYWGGIYKAKTSLLYNTDPNTVVGQTTHEQLRVSKDSAWFFARPALPAALAEVSVLVVLVWLIATPIRRVIRRRRIIKRWEKYVVQTGDTLMTIAAARGASWRNIAKHNHIKAPYIVEVGRPIIVPKPKQTKMQRSVKKSKKSEIDWFDDELATPNVPVQQAASEATPPVRTEAVRPQPSATLPTDWISPRESSYDLEEYDEDFVDWREGADRREVVSIEHRLQGYAATPRLNKQIERPQKSSSKPKRPKRKKRT